MSHLQDRPDLDPKTARWEPMTGVDVLALLFIGLGAVAAWVALMGG